MNQPTDSENSNISILIVNYKTRRLTELCLSLIKQKFDLERLQVIVVDNDSADDSLDYLRSLDWIQLIERRTQTSEKGHIAHSAALDVGMQAVTSKYVLLMHTDTLIKDSSVLDLLLEKIADGSAVCVGSVDQRNRKFLSRLWRSTKRIIRYGKNNKPLPEILERKRPRPNDYYIKSFCSLWDASVIRELDLKFCAAGRNPGYEMQDQALDLGYKLIKINPQELFRYVSHVQGGTDAETGVHDKNHRRTISYRNLISEYSRKEFDESAQEGENNSLG